MSDELFADLNKKTGKTKATEPETKEPKVAPVVDTDADIQADLSGSSDSDTLADTGGDIVLPDTTIKHDEAASLRRQADLLGIKYKEGASVDLLEYLIDEKLKEQEKAQTTSAATQATRQAVSSGVNFREQIYREEMRLVRIRLVNMDDKDKALGGDFFSVCNKYIGDVIKFIPYSAATSEYGYYVPYCIYKQLRDAKTVQFNKTMVQGREVTKTRLVKKFAIEVLPNLSQAEFDELKQRQLATGSTKDE